MICETIQGHFLKDKVDGAKNKKSDNGCSKFQHIFKTYVIDSTKETYKTITKKRNDNFRVLIFIQLIIYAIYIFSMQEMSLTYLYTSRQVNLFENTIVIKESH